MPLAAVALLLTALLTLTACGGGSSGSAGDSPSAPAGEAGNGQTPVDQAELRISPDNDLRALTDLSIEIQMSTQRSFVSICPHPGGELAVASFDYDACMVRASLDSNLKLIDLPLPNHVDRLVAIVWYYEVNREPLVRTWQRDAGGGPLSGSIWRINEAG